MGTNKIKKKIILNAPYVLIGLFATNFGEAWRIAKGVTPSEKILDIVNALQTAISDPLPSFAPMDLMVGVACALALRLAVYIKGRNAKKFRQGEEYGAARWSA